MDLRPIQKHLQQIPCPVHGELPCISILGDHLEIRCCCDAFRRETPSPIQIADVPRPWRRQGPPPHHERKRVGGIMFRQQLK